MNMILTSNEMIKMIISKDYVIDTIDDEIAEVSFNKYIGIELEISSELKKIADDKFNGDLSEALEKILDESSDDIDDEIQYIPIDVINRKIKEYSAECEK